MVVAVVVPQDSRAAQLVDLVAVAVVETAQDQIARLLLVPQIPEVVAAVAVEQPILQAQQAAPAS
jgi:hypothetical protein